jgi:exonuclease III
MSSEVLEGSGQPGIPRPLRLDQRSATTSAEIDLGNDVANSRNCPLGRICVWPRIPGTTHRWWATWDHILRHRIVSVRRVRPKASSILRYDVYVPKTNLNWAFRKLKRLAARYEWVVKIHKSYRARCRSRRQKAQHILRPIQDTENERRESVGQNSPTHVFHTKMATWNINRMTSKRQEIENMLRASRVEILAMQETGRDCNGWPLRLQGYNILESVAGKRCCGQHGLALCVSEKFAMHEKGIPSPYLLHACCRLGNAEWNIVNVYIPCSGEYRKHALADLRTTLTSIFHHDLSAKVIVMGDFNTDPGKLSKLWVRWRLPLVVVTPAGNPATYWGKKQRWSPIDHMVVSAEATVWAKSPRVNRTWDISDHWPLEMVLRGPTEADYQGIQRQVMNRGIRLKTFDSKTSRQDILRHNRWEVLYDLLDTEEGVECDNAFQEAVLDIATDLDLVQEPPSRDNKPLYRLSPGAKRAIRRRRKAYAEWLHERQPDAKQALWNFYLEYKRLACKAKRESSQASWQRFIEKGANSLAKNDMKGFWGWVKQVTHRGRGGTANMGPIQLCNGPADTFAYTPEEKLVQWSLHYQQLLRDVTGHSQSRMYWERKLPGEASNALPDINGPITWLEVNGVLHRMKVGTAPGCDGIPPSFYKIAMADIDSVSPSSAMGKVILKICNLVFDKGEIPKSWNEAWVVSIFKKGDPKCMDNYRGISLIVVFLKLITTIVTTRLQNVLEESKWFTKAQAGFRTREECVAQACCLYELLSRRKAMGKRTYVAFIDFRKAYDTVPIEALLRKLELIGVSGKALQYFRALYESPHIRVKTRYGYSDMVQLSRGLRQGCNASPLLFDIFINDILINCSQFGVKVLGLNQRRRICGLLFADDVVLMAPTTQTLHQALANIQKWATIFEMSFGVSKCGVMGLGDGAQERITNSQDQWILDGQAVPIVTEYTYLGLLFNKDLDLSIMAKARADLGQRALGSLRPVLASPTISSLIKTRVIQAILIPTLSYGGELWGMGDSRAQPGQGVLNEALRLMLRLKKRCSITSSSALGLEFDVAPLAATTSAARTRGFLKYRSLRTYIADLVASPPTTRNWTWVSGSRRWLQRYCATALQVQPICDAVDSVKNIITTKHQQGSTVAERYMRWRLDQSRQYLKEVHRFPSDCKGLLWLTRLRVNAFWSARAFQKIRWLPEEYDSLCPFCNLHGSGETIEHFLATCSKWHAERRLYLGHLLDMGASFINLLGGSSTEGGISAEENLKIWLFNEIQQLAPAENVGSHAPGFIQVARFLQQVMPKRLRLLADLLRAPRANADINGRADLMNHDLEEDVDMVNRRGMAAT